MTKRQAEPEACENCGDSGIVGVMMSPSADEPNGVKMTPVTCHCEIGQNALAANPEWETAGNVDAPGIGRTEGLEI